MTVKISKAGALFNFLLQHFELSKQIGELKYDDLMAIVEFLDTPEFKQLSGK